jgi:hypothetical protein
MSDASVSFQSGTLLPQPRRQKHRPAECAAVDVGAAVTAVPTKQLMAAVETVVGHVSAVAEAPIARMASRAAHSHAVAEERICGAPAAWGGYVRVSSSRVPRRAQGSPTDARVLVPRSRCADTRQLCAGASCQRAALAFLPGAKCKVLRGAASGGINSRSGAALPALVLSSPFRGAAAAVPTGRKHPAHCPLTATRARDNGACRALGRTLAGASDEVARRRAAEQAAGG